MAQEVYVWQRVWTDPVGAAVKERAEQFDGVCVLVAEVDRKGDGSWEVQRFADPEAYARGHEVSLAVRIASGASISAWDRESCDRIVSLLGHYAGMTSVFQIDYDCPSGKLSDYVRLCAALRRAFPDHRLELTCLPDWLGRDGFSSLVEYADRYVMQVHGLLGYGGGQRLCDPELAREAAWQCGELGVPFLIALPTYRHAVGVGVDGGILDVVSEGEELRQGVTYQLRGADHQEMASLVREWEESRPESMIGVIWYRLPVDGESMNWTWASLQRVMQGMEVEKQWSMKMEPQDDGMYLLKLENKTVANLELPRVLQVSWLSGYCLTSDGMGAYKVSHLERDSKAVLKWQGGDPRPMPPGTSLAVAWFRYHVQPEAGFRIIECRE
ncbi:DUF3142 domain-containing protein [Verrucomicrobiaceae bacterium N1E253]|uniref:DUF3142 domain-containing protein n=1 Tax=Oceaniferula marina TaxID=2748318 RepID=A0A851GLK0_9BACT|nr:DUF3142 domain-containing protein [Oceaniferula marina]NWK56045.1 DUF3142 domain-containing protein [Oceaniferula marina]